MSDVTITRKCRLVHIRKVILAAILYGTMVPVTGQNMSLEEATAAQCIVLESGIHR